MFETTFQKLGMPNQRALICEVVIILILNNWRQQK
jgi:hypothetical protein